MATTNFCEMAARYLDMIESDGLDFASELAGEIAWCCDDLSQIDRDIADFLASQLNNMRQIEYVSELSDPFWIDVWANNHIPAPVVPSIEQSQPSAIATMRARIEASCRHTIHFVVSRAFRNSFRIAGLA